MMANTPSVTAPASNGSVPTQKARSILVRNDGWFSRHRGRQRSARDHSLIVDPPLSSEHTNGVKPNRQMSDRDETDLRRKLFDDGYVLPHDEDSYTTPSSQKEQYVAAFADTIAIWPLSAFTSAFILFCIFTMSSTPTSSPSGSTPSAAGTSSDWGGPGQVLVYSALVATTAWFVFALFHVSATTVWRANPTSYNQLCEKYRLIHAHLEGLRHVYINTVEDDDALTHSRVAYQEASVFVRAATAELNMQRGALRWTNSSGYINLWSILHRAEESLMLIRPLDAVATEGRYDELRLRASAIEAKDDLLTILRQALFALKEPKLRETLDRDPALHEQRARTMIGGTRKAINEFRDDLRAGLVRARNELMRTVAVTSLVIYIFFAIIVLSAAHENTNAHWSIISAIAIFFIGAIIGLFNRLYIVSTSDSAVEDYGLTSARLVNTPLFSGLASVGGVLLSVLLPMVTQNALPLGTQNPLSTQTTAQLQEIFNISKYPFELILAAVFGLTPGFLVTRLQKQTEDYKAALISTQPTQRPEANR